MENLIEALGGLAAIGLLAWLALGRVPVLGGVIKSVLKLTFLSAPLVAVTIFGFFAVFEVPGWFGSGSDRPTATEPVPVLLVKPAQAAPESAPEPPRRAVVPDPDATPFPIERPDD